ncbi:MAG: hypothetical protein KGZ58_06845 [Ignavibacteriales bacterium]|nr:hypothetical protein [Ignavibacteriales bacterium]
MNKDNLTFIIPLTLILLCIIGGGYYLFSTTGQDGEQEEQIVEKRTQYNLLVLLDLSDRVLKPRQVAKDTAIINYLFDFAVSDAKKNLFVNSRNSFNIIVAPQNTDTVISNAIYRISSSLTIQLNNISAVKRRTSLEKFKLIFFPALSELYSFALKNSNFVGADIWSFFKNDLKGMLQQTQNQNDSIRNVLIVLTDGYLNFNSEIEKQREIEGFKTSYMERQFRNNPKWRKKFLTENHGLIPIDEDFGSIEVLVLEINPLFPNQPSELDMIKTYWQQWFTEMKIKRFKIYKTEDNLPLIKQHLNDFLK